MDGIKVLVTGGNGQLAKTIGDVYGNRIKGANYTIKTREHLDISDSQSILNALSEKDYTFLVNCAAYTDVDGAETHKEQAFSINSTSVGNLAEICQEKNIVLIHISTDYVFDGRSQEPYKEEDLTNPINVYGASKLLGEQLIEETSSQYFIIRTSWLYSYFGKNFVKTIISNIKKGKDLKIITSQIGTPTSCIDLAHFIDELISKRIQEYGIFHFSALGETDWFGFAKHIASHYSHYQPEKLQPIDHYPTIAQRPVYSVLDNTKSSSIFALKDWRSSLDLLIGKIG